MLNWLRGKFGKKTAKTNNLVILDNNSKDSVTFVNKIPEGPKSDQDALDFFGEIDTSGFESQIASNEVSDYLTITEKNISSAELSGALKKIQEEARNATKIPPSKPNTFYTMTPEIAQRMANTRKINEEFKTKINQN